MSKVKIYCSIEYPQFIVSSDGMCRARGDGQACVGNCGMEAFRKSSPLRKSLSGIYFEATGMESETMARSHVAQLGSQSKRKASFIEPMDCAPVSKLPDGPRWLFEIKLDGYRKKLMGV